MLRFLLAQRLTVKFPRSDTDAIPISESIFLHVTRQSQPMFEILNNVLGFVNPLVNPDSFDPPCTGTAEMVERHSILLWIDGILKPIL